MAEREDSPQNLSTVRYKQDVTKQSPSFQQAKMLNYIEMSTTPPKGARRRTYYLRETRR